MTSGTTTRDYRITSVKNFQACSGFQNATVKEGLYYQKIWSGANSPTSAIAPVTYDSVTYPLFDKHGVKKGERKVILKSRRSKYVTSCRDNAYSMSLTQRVDTWGYQDINCGAGIHRGYIISSYGWNCFAYDRIIWNSLNDYSLYGKLADELGSGFNLAIFLGEGKESLRTITDAASRIYRAAKEVKKGRITNAANILIGGGKSPGGKRRNNRKVFSSVKQDTKDFASNWLQLQYGWLPLLKDVFSAAKHLAYLQNRPFTATYRVSKSAYWTGTDTIGPGFSDKYTGWVKESHRLVAKVTSVNEAALIGLTNPAAVAWELIPYSFVFDWFIPVGNYLEAMNLRGALSGSFVLTKYKDGRVYNVFNFGIPDKYALAFYVRKLSVDRTVSSSLPVKLPAVKPLDKVASFSHCVNAVALVTQFLRP